MAFDKTTEAVEALHKTMVMLREELAKKNAKIKVLEVQLNSNLESINTIHGTFTGSFTDTFLATVSALSKNVNF